MDISTFRQLADQTTQIIASWPNDLITQYQFLSLPQTGTYTTGFIGNELYNRIHKAFIPGEIKIAEQCRALIGELIYDQILDNQPIEPYCELLAKIRDATQSLQTVGNDTCEEWRNAIEYAHLSVQHMSLNETEGLQRTYSNYFAVGFAALRLRSIGYTIDRDGSKMTLSGQMESRLVAKIESLVHDFGGVYVTRQISDFLRAVYDEQQERYHLVVPKPKATEPQQPLLPWGYLLQLAVKHYQGGKSSGIADHKRFKFLIELIRDYATILEVQDYSDFPHFPFVPAKMLKAVQEKALADSLYKIPQVRGSDVTRILNGLIDSTIVDEPFEKGWTIRQAITVIDVILNQLAGQGLTRIYSRDVRKRCRSIPGDLVNVILSEVLSHPQTGANQKFSKPTDAPNVSPNHSSDDGADFAQLPLLRYTDQSYILLDRSFCSGAFIECIFSQMRKNDTNFDRDYLGKALERFTKEVLLQHNIKSYTGNYWIGQTRWECDIVVETADFIILIEVKKKPLTRRARAGSDISLVLDLAQSLLDAQKQAGNHEMQLRKEGYLDLHDNGEIHRIELNGRKIERIALSFTDFGSFHDRMFLEKFLTAVTKLKFSVSDSRYKRQFDEINRAIASLQDQNRFLYPEDGQHHRPYFNSWFFSLPQLMIILDHVNDAEEFRDALWGIRGMSNGHGDLYYDIRYVEHMKTSNPQWYAVMLQMAHNDKTFITG